MGEALLLGGGQRAADGPIRRGAIGPDDHDGRQLIGGGGRVLEGLEARLPRPGLLGPPRRGGLLAQPLAAGLQPALRRRARPTGGRRSGPSPAAPRAPAAAGRPCVAPSSRVPKWTSIMKNVMSWSTTSSSGVRFGLSRPDVVRWRRGMRHLHPGTRVGFVRSDPTAVHSLDGRRRLGGGQRGPPAAGRGARRHRGADGERVGMRAAATAAMPGRRRRPGRRSGRPAARPARTAPAAARPSSRPPATAARSGCGTGRRNRSPGSTARSPPAWRRGPSRSPPRAGWPGARSPPTAMTRNARIIP